MAARRRDGAQAQRRRRRRQRRRTRTRTRRSRTRGSRSAFVAWAGLLALLLARLPPARGGADGGAALVLPRTVDDLQRLGRVWHAYATDHFAATLLAFLATYTFLQTFRRGEQRRRGAPCTLPSSMAHAAIAGAASRDDRPEHLGGYIFPSAWPSPPSASPRHGSDRLVPHVAYVGAGARARRRAPAAHKLAGRDAGYGDPSLALRYARPACRPCGARWTRTATTCSTTWSSSASPRCCPTGSSTSPRPSWASP